MTRPNPNPHPHPNPIPNQGWLVVLAWLLACVILAAYRTWLARRARAAVELGESLRAPSVPWSHGDDTGGGGGGGGGGCDGGGGGDSAGVERRAGPGAREIAWLGAAEEELGRWMDDLMHRQAEVERRLQGAETARLTAQADALATRGREGARVERADSRSRTLAASMHGAAFNPNPHPKANPHPHPHPHPNPNQLSGGRAYAGRGRPSPASSDCERARRRRSAFSAESAARGSVGPTRRRRTTSAWLAYSASTSCATSSACPRCRPPSSERSRRASCAPSPTSPAPPPPANHHPRAS